MDVLGAFLQAQGWVQNGGAAASHPVTRPDFTLEYGQKDITADIAPYLTALSYTDYLEGQSDEIQIELEDTDGRWLRGWYPEQGDVLSLSLGDQFTGLIKLGRFEIAEIEYRRPPDTVSIKALAAGITKANRTRQAKAYENQTLADIVRTVARRLKLKVSGEVRPIKLGRVTQYQERDIEFLARLAKEYGHSFKIVGKTLVFAANEDLAAQKAVAVINPADVIRLRLRDLIKGVPQEAVVSGYDAKKKRHVQSRRKAKPRRQQSKRGTTGDTLKIVAVKGESQEQADARADAALNDAQNEQCAGSITLFGNAKLVAGQTVELKNHGKFSGKYLVKQARHDLRRSAGYTTELEIKMLEYIPEADERPSEKENADA